ncbi:MAG TPA: TetR family transcriptional regulator [Mycobacteriales bacterium]|jgi:AcrR family transcriptional regulator|nr:TetR family transcriptional regulator [Mycobacteriales bacterium]
MAGKSRRDEYAEQTRAAVVAAAIELFAGGGYAATTIDAVATQARVAKGGVYHHFANKAELFEAAFIAMEERLLARVVAVIESTADMEQMVLAGIDTFLIECLDPQFRRIALEEAPAALGWERWKEIDETFFMGLMKGGLADLASTGRFEIHDEELTARVLFAALTEAGLSAANAPDPTAALDGARALLSQLIDGLRKKP